jgi:lysophospholipase L1-like esterase
MMQKAKTVLKISGSILLGLVFMEFALRITGIYNSYSEKIGEKFFTYYNYSHKLHYKILPINEVFTYTQKEFTISFKTNYLGMRNDKMAITPPDSVYRIICLGDSFTEGDGANNGKEYPRQLENILRETKHKPFFEVINAGKNGSDIIYAEKIFIQELYRLSPDMVILCVNESDIDDIIIRGGTERFKADCTTSFKKGPKYLPIYARFHLFRMFVHTFLGKDKLFLTKKERAIETKKAINEMTESISRMKNFVNDKGISLIVVVHPTPNPAISKTRKNSEIYIQKICDKNLLNPLLNQSDIEDISFALFDSLSQYSYHEYAWPINGHFNDLGYGIMANEIHKVIEPHLKADKIEH